MTNLVEGIAPRRELVIYAVRGCWMAFPGTGATQAWRVLRVYGRSSADLSDGPCVAVFAHGLQGAGKEMAQKYAEYLMQTQTEVI